MYLVDLPGYGYAKVSEKEKIQWGKLIERYLHSSKQLKAVFLLIDIRPVSYTHLDVYKRQDRDNCV